MAMVTNKTQVVILNQKLSKYLKQTRNLDF